MDNGLICNHGRWKMTNAKDGEQEKMPSRIGNKVSFKYPGAEGSEFLMR